MLSMRHCQILSTVARIVDALSVRHFNVGSEEELDESRDLLNENRELFPLVKELYISETKETAKARFDVILGRGQDAESARKLHFVIREMFCCGGTEYGELMLNIKDNLGWEKFGNRMNWFLETLFEKNLLWDNRSNDNYFFVNGFSSKALNSTADTFAGFVR